MTRLRSAPGLLLVAVLVMVALLCTTEPEAVGRSIFVGFFVFGFRIFILEDFEGDVIALAFAPLALCLPAQPLALTH